MNDGPKYFPKYLGGTYYPHFMAGAEGLEPSTHGLTADCATATPISHIMNNIIINIVQ